MQQWNTWECPPKKALKCVTFFEGFFSQENLKKSDFELSLLLLVGARCFHGQYFSTLLSLLRSHQQRVVPACYKNVCSLLCSLLYDLTASLLSSPLLSSPLLSSPLLSFQIPDFLRISPWWLPCELKRALSSSCFQCMMTRGCSSWGSKWAVRLSSCMRTSMGSPHQKCTPSSRRSTWLMESG